MIKWNIFLQKRKRLEKITRDFFNEKFQTSKAGVVINIMNLLVSSTHEYHLMANFVSSVNPLLSQSSHILSFHLDFSALSLALKFSLEYVWQDLPNMFLRTC